MMRQVLDELSQHRSLDKDTAKQVLIDIASGQINPSQISAFITVYMMRSVTIDELQGFRDAMLELCVPVDVSEFDAMDLCGTGGDGKDTFNISTLSNIEIVTTILQYLFNGRSSV